MIKKIALVGSGYIATYLSNHLPTPFLNISQSGFNGEKLELQNSSEFNYSSLDNIEYIIFTAAVSSPDACYNNYESSYSVNVTGTSFFINQALKRNCKVIFFSSDAVYDAYNSNIVLDENNESNSYSPYGKMKKQIEDEFKFNSNFKSIRLSYVLSTTDKYSSYLFNCINNSTFAEVFHPFYRNCIFIDDVRDVVLWLLDNWEIFETSFINICGNELISRVRIADELKKVYPELQYKIITPNEEFFINRNKIIEIKSLYINEILRNNTTRFSEKFAKYFKKG